MGVSGRVQIFGGVYGLTWVFEAADPQKRWDVPGNHEWGTSRAVSEAVIRPTLGLTHYRETTLHQEVVGKPLFLHRLIEGIPGCRRITQPKTDGDTPA